MSAGRAPGFGLEDLPRIVRGEGSWLIDSAGRRYLDGSGGPAAFCLGHANAEVNAAITAQLERIACAYRYLFTSDALEALTALIIGHCGGSLRHVVYCGSGSEAVESSLKIALQYWDARGRPEKRRFIARERSYHGNTLGALSVSGFAERRRHFEGSLLPVEFVSAANSYRPPAGVEAAQLTAYLARELDERIRAVGAEHVAAFIYEPVVGAAGGVVPAPPGYAAAVREVCARHEVLVIADEVMCGSGRCGSWRALEHEGVEPDIMAVAKGLAGGYIPLGASVFSASIGATLLSAHGAFMTGHTYSGHTAACAAGLAVQGVIAREGLLKRVRERGMQLLAGVGAALAGFAEVGDVRGRGYFVGVELVRDRDSREPFSAARALAQDIGRRAFAHGLIVYPCSGNAGEGRGDTLIIAPPFNATDDELEFLIERLRRAVGEALAARA